MSPTWAVTLSGTKDRRELASLESVLDQLLAIAPPTGQRNGFVIQINEPTAKSLRFSTGQTGIHCECPFFCA